MQGGRQAMGLRYLLMKSMPGPIIASKLLRESIGKGKKGHEPAAIL